MAYIFPKLKYWKTLLIIFIIFTKEIRRCASALDIDIFKDLKLDTDNYATTNDFIRSVLRVKDELKEIEKITEIFEKQEINKIHNRDLQKSDYFKNDVLLKIDFNKDPSQVDNDPNRLLQRDKRDQKDLTEKLKKLQVYDNGKFGVIAHELMKKRILSKRDGKEKSGKHLDPRDNDILGLKVILDDEADKWNKSMNESLPMLKKSKKNPHEILKRLLNKLISLYHLKRQIMLPNPQMKRFDVSTESNRILTTSNDVKTTQKNNYYKTTSMFTKLIKSTLKGGNKKSKNAQSKKHPESKKQDNNKDKRFAIEIERENMAGFRSSTMIKALEPYPTFSDPILHHNLSPIQAPTIRHPFQIVNKHVQVIDGNLPNQKSKFTFNNLPNVKGIVPYETFHSKNKNPHPLQSMKEAEKLMEVDLGFHERNEPENDNAPLFFINEEDDDVLRQNKYGHKSQKSGENGDILYDENGLYGNNFRGDRSKPQNGRKSLSLDLKENLVENFEKNDTKPLEKNEFHFIEATLPDSQNKTKNSSSQIILTPIELDENSKPNISVKATIKKSSKETLLTLEQKIFQPDLKSNQNQNSTNSEKSGKILHRVKRDIDLADENADNYDEVDNVIKSKFVSGLDYENGEGSPVIQQDSKRRNLKKFLGLENELDYFEEFYKENLLSQDIDETNLEEIKKKYRRIGRQANGLGKHQKSKKRKKKRSKKFGRQRRKEKKEDTKKEDLENAKVEIEKIGAEKSDEKSEKSQEECEDCLYQKIVDEANEERDQKKAKRVHNGPLDQKQKKSKFFQKNFKNPKTAHKKQIVEILDEKGNVRIVDKNEEAKNSQLLDLLNTQYHDPSLDLEGPDANNVNVQFELKDPSPENYDVKEYDDIYQKRDLNPKKMGPKVIFLDDVASRSKDDLEDEDLINNMIDENPSEYFFENHFFRNGKNRNKRTPDKWLKFDKNLEEEEKVLKKSDEKRDENNDENINDETTVPETQPPETTTESTVEPTAGQVPDAPQNSAGQVPDAPQNSAGQVPDAPQNSAAQNPAAQDAAAPLAAEQPAPEPTTTTEEEVTCNEEDARLQEELAPHVETTTQNICVTTNSAAELDHDIKALETEEEDLNNAKGNLPSKIVASVFQEVQQEENMRNLLGTSFGKDDTAGRMWERIEQYESEERQSKLKHTEQLLHSIMLAINNIIVEQVASHTCQKIEPDMREYLAKLTSIIKPSSEEKLAKAKEMQKMLNLDVSASQIPFLFYMPPKERTEFKKSEVIQKRKIIEDLLSKYNRLPASDKSRYETLEEYLQDQDMKLRIIVRKIEHDERRKKSQKTIENFSKSKKYQKLVETEKEIRKKRSEDRNMMYQDYVKRSRNKRSFQEPLILKYTINPFFKI